MTSDVNAPERIWAFVKHEADTDYSELIIHCLGDEPYDDSIEYVRADMAVEVKPLEWVDYGDGTFRTCAHGYDYEAAYEDESGSFCWYGYLSDSFCRGFEDISSAKAAAQADYERRILGSLRARPIAEIEAAAFRRGAEQMRERAADELAHHLTFDEDVTLSEIWQERIRALPLTEEDKANG